MMGGLFEGAPLVLARNVQLSKKHADLVTADSFGKNSGLPRGNEALHRLV